MDLEENIDSVQLKCQVDANPPATVIWRRHGGSSAPVHLSTGGSNDIYSFQEVLEFSPVTRKDSATYSCEAKNKIGTSKTITVPIDVKCKSSSTFRMRFNCHSSLPSGPSKQFPQ